MSKHEIEEIRELTSNFLAEFKNNLKSPIDTQYSMAKVIITILLNTCIDLTNKLNKQLESEVEDAK